MTAETEERKPFAESRGYVEPSSIRLQWLGGFYPSGAIIALEIRAVARPGCDEKLMKLFNPADPVQAQQLYRYSKSNRILVEIAADSVLSLFHGSQARQELRTLIDRAQAHVARCRRLDWRQTEEHFLESVPA